MRVRIPVRTGLPEIWRALCVLILFLASQTVWTAEPAPAIQQTTPPSVNLTTDSLFAADRLLEVQVTIAPADWDALRNEHHDVLLALGPSRFDSPEPKPYRIYRADVTIGGVTMKSVGLRKRGFLGSASYQRPSLGIKFDEFDPKKEFCGLKRISLNNNLQDLSQLHQFLAYRIFRLAGVPAPRCSFARVTVNGTSLGVYSHVEAIDKTFLKKNFGSASGHLYEGQLSDFRPEWVKTFEQKNHRDDPGQAELEAVVKALQAEDAQLLAQLEPLVDVDAYLSYWAVESLIGHWYSYSNNGNNFFIYRDPADHKFHFIPWGADSVLGAPDPFTPFKPPESVQARSILPYRLYRLPATCERYRERLRQVLKSAWNERALLDEVDRLEELLKPHVHFSQAQFQKALDNVRRFIRTRRSGIEPELAGPAPAWNFPLKQSACLQKSGRVTANFTTTWQEHLPLNPLTNGVVNLVWEFAGQEQSFTATGVIAGPIEDARYAGCHAISLFGLQPTSLRVQALVLIIQPESYKPKSSEKIDGFRVAGICLDGSLLGWQFKFSFLPLGTVDLLDAGAQPGEKVTGKIKADLYRLVQ